jgi:IPT/TIG domain/Bacterial Ig-like domain
MRKITTAITAAALAFSMLASAVPAAAAVPGYDSAYAGESAFVNITAGQTQNFQVFFANTGTTAWTRGSGTQVDLAACLEDKVTCNAQDASEATWNSGWLSAVRYATTVQTVTPPGSLGTFSYNITAPAGVAAGIYRFNGDLVLASTGEKIHPDGYYQEANTGAASGAPTITLLTPNTGQAGTDVTISGTGFVCTPAFPTASFGGVNGTVLSCGATSITVDAPAHALGAATVTVSNSGSGASNGLTFIYTDVSGPTFQSFTVSGDTLTVTFSEPVCRQGGTADLDWNVQNISSPGGTDLAAAGTTDNLPTDCDDAVATFNVFLPLGTSVPNGSFVEATLNAVGVATTATDNEDIIDASGNEAAAPQSRQATATAPETTRPTFITATGAVGQPVITLTFSEAVYCDGTLITTDFNIDEQGTTSDPTVIAVGDTNACGTGRDSADTSFNIRLGSNLESDTSYVVTITSAASGDIQDAVGNTLTVPASVTFTSGAGDFTPPTIVDARVTSNLGTSDFGETNGDAFSLTFSEVMNGSTTGRIDVQDQDGTIASGGLVCGGNVTCTWNTADTTLTVTVQGAPILVPTVGNPGAGTTPGLQIPFNVTAIATINDETGNPPNVLGSSDRLVDFE